MKKITNLEDFENIDEGGASSIKSRKDAPVKAKFRFEVSDNLKKVVKIQKTLIDTMQLLTEMADEIVALKVNFPQMDPNSMKVMNNMAYNLKNMITALKDDKKRGSETGMLDNVGRLKRNLEKLKVDFINKPS